MKNHETQKHFNTSSTPFPSDRVKKNLKKNPRNYFKSYVWWAI